MESFEPTAFDKLLGTSPHYASCTDYGVFCPACSDPHKLSFVLASSCELAVQSSSRTEKDQLWAEAMVAAGLRKLLPGERSRSIENHQIAFKAARARWQEERHTDSL